MDDAKRNADDYESDEMLVDDELRISHQNMLWLLYRILSEDIITTEELDNMAHMIR